jgi:hypothetical protein
METKLEGIAAKALSEPILVIYINSTSCDKGLIWDSLCHISTDTATGIDGIDVETAKKNFDSWWMR